MRLQRKQNPSGFTLIELLVVVAIIVVLIAILLPSLARARQQAVVTSCLGNLHHIGIIFETYTHENAQKYPRQAGGVDWLDNPYWDDLGYWYTVIPVNTLATAGYLIDKKVGYCNARGQTLQFDDLTPYTYGTGFLHFLFRHTAGAGEGAEWNPNFMGIVNYEVYHTGVNFVPSVQTPPSVPVASCWFSVPDPGYGKHNYGTTANILLRDGSAYSFTDAAGVMGTGPAFH